MNEPRESSTPAEEATTPTSSDSSEDKPTAPNWRKELREDCIRNLEKVRQNPPGNMPE